jgi:O-succinylbenzoate synthase
VHCRAYAYGETSPFAAPTYSPEWAGGVFATMRDWLAPHLVGKEIGSGYELQRLLSIFKGNPFAKAGLDTAFWNLDAKVQGKPLHELLGATRDSCVVGADFGVQDSLDSLVEKIGEAVDRCVARAQRPYSRLSLPLPPSLFPGPDLPPSSPPAGSRFPRIKLKMMPGWDANMLDRVRQAFPDFTFHIDSNCGYALDDPIWESIDTYQLAMVEQPLAYAACLGAQPGWRPPPPCTIHTIHNAAAMLRKSGSAARPARRPSPRFRAS